MHRTIVIVAFEQLGTRIIEYLKQKIKIYNVTILKITHQEIAYDLKHVSRSCFKGLINLEKRGRIELSRNKIKVNVF